jgi:hypothetical protein
MEGTINQTIDQNYNDISKVETEQVPIIDPGVGDAIVLRNFFFKAIPVPKGTPRPTKAQLFGQFQNMIFTQLWADGLRPIEERKVEIHTKAELKSLSKTLWAECIKSGADFVIMVMAAPRKGVRLDERPLKLNQRMT